jgi:rhodanese-related sulfurtransferase
MKRVTPEQAHRLLRDEGAILIDVRGDNAYQMEREHVPGDLRFTPIELERSHHNLPHGAEVITYCT